MRFRSLASTEDYGANTIADTRDRVFQFDAIGNRQKTASGTLELPETPNYSANALNQYTLAGGVTLPTSPAPAPHDEDGNYSRGPIPVASGNATLNWDAENRLVKITRADSVVITYAYDFQGRRISKTVDEGTSRYFFYEGWNPIAEFSGTTLEKTYLWGMDLSGFIQGAGGVGGLHAVKEGANHYYPTFDGNGNVSEYLNSSGVPVAHYEYDAFGRNATVPTGTKANDFAHRFSTKFFDSESGFYYYGYRYFDPVTGRWPSRDPIEEEGGVNLHSFLNNNCPNTIDFLGKQCRYYCNKNAMLGGGYICILFSDPDKWGCKFSSDVPQPDWCSPLRVAFFMMICKDGDLKVRGIFQSEYITPTRNGRPPNSA